MSDNTLAGIKRRAARVALIAAAGAAPLLTAGAAHAADLPLPGGLSGVTQPDNAAQQLGGATGGALAGGAPSAQDTAGKTTPQDAPAANPAGSTAQLPALGSGLPHLG